MTRPFKEPETEYESRDFCRVYWPKHHQLTLPFDGGPHPTCACGYVDTTRKEEKIEEG